MLAHALDALNGDLCLGVLALPFAVPNLIAAGLTPSKVRSVFPAVDYARFLSRAPNGDGVLAVGAALPKKQFADFVKLAALVPSREFNLYQIGYHGAALQTVNEAFGNPVTIREPVEPDEMPAVYKRHRWLVVTASREIGTVGWPLCIAEAQASGLGVCVPSLRDDLKEYAGENAVYYDSIEELTDVVTRPYPEELREPGFWQARKSDIAAHKTELTGLWYAGVSR